MLRLNLLLLAALAACALGLVTSQHQARKLYVELQNLSRAPVDGKIDIDSTWFTHAWLKRPLMTTNRPISMN